MDEEQIKIWAKETLGKMSDSAVFLGICSDNFVKDPSCLIQFGLSVLLDKPIFLLIEKDFNPGKNLIRILEGYEFYEPEDEDSAKQASIILFEKIEKFLEKSR